MGGIHERQQELRRRRKRREKYAKFKVKAAKATTSEKAVMAAKIRKMSVGAEAVIASLQLEER